MSKIGIVIGNLGTPQSPHPTDVKKYLKQFLMDPFVIDKPYWFRWLLVNLIIAPFRSHKSAEAYQSIWTKEGSPLMAISEKVVKAVQKKMGDEFKVVLGMRYGEPSLDAAIKSVEGCEKIVLFPQYPQYAESSTKTWVVEAEKVIRQRGLKQPIVNIEAFYDREEYLSALTKKIDQELMGKEIDLVLMSYHGLPERHLQKLDPSQSHCLKSPNCCDSINKNNALCYRAQCYSVSRQIAQRLKLKNYRVSFQSRLGREPWIQPFTDVVLEQLPQQGFKKIAVIMPAFTVDCLETLEEIHIRAQEEFKLAGGEIFYPIACLNDDDFWIEQLTQMIRKSIL